MPISVHRWLSESAIKILTFVRFPIKATLLRDVCNYFKWLNYAAVGRS